MDVVERAQRLADDLLFPAALDTDASEVVPREILDALAAEGLYGGARAPSSASSGSGSPRSTQPRPCARASTASPSPPSA